MPSCNACTQTDEGRVCGDCLFTAGSGKLRRGEGTPPYI